MPLTVEGVMGALERRGMTDEDADVWATELALARAVTAMEGYTVLAGSVRDGVVSAAGSAVEAITQAKESVEAVKTGLGSTHTPDQAMAVALAARQTVGAALASLGAALASAGASLGGGQ